MSKLSITLREAEEELVDHIMLSVGAESPQDAIRHALIVAAQLLGADEGYLQEAHALLTNQSYTVTDLDFYPYPPGTSRGNNVIGRVQ